jgi:Sec-independent protein translocase protein TatA
MGTFSPSHWLIVVLNLFGAGRIPVREVGEAGRCLLVKSDGAP